MIGDAHGRFGRSAGASAIIVIKRVWLWNGHIIVEMSVLLVRLPRTMRCFVVIAEEERLLLRPILHKINGHVGNEVGRIAFQLLLSACVDENRIVIKALARQDVPVIEASRIAAEMP